MAVSFAPDNSAQWGKSLGNIGSWLQNMINPGLKFQNQYATMLADPAKAQELANAAHMNPEFYNESNPMIGGNIASHLSKLSPDPGFLNKLTANQEANRLMGRDPQFREEAATGVTPGTQTSLARRGQKADVGRKEITLDQLQKYDEFLQSKPDVQLQSYYREALGMTEPEWKTFQDKHKRYEQGRNMAVTNPRQFLLDFVAGKVEANDLEAFSMANPTAFSTLSNFLSDEERNKFQLRLRSMMNNDSGEGGLSARMKADMLQAAIRRAEQTGVKIGSAWQAIWGTEPPSYAGASDPQEIARLRSLENAEREKTFTQQNLDILTKIDGFEQSFAEADNPGSRNVAMGNINAALENYNRVNGTRLRFGQARDGATGYIDPQNNLVGLSIGSLSANPPRTGVNPRVDVSAPITVTPGGTSGPADATVANAIQMIKDGKGTLQQMEASNLTEAQKARIRAGVR